MKNDLVSLHVSVTECAKTEQFSDYPRIVFIACLTVCSVCGGNGNKEACDNLGSFDDLQDLPLWPSADTQKVTVQSLLCIFLQCELSRQNTCCLNCFLVETIKMWNCRE